jgi:hypothetical protein
MALTNAEKQARCIKTDYGRRRKPSWRSSDSKARAFRLGRGSAPSAVLGLNPSAKSSRTNAASDEPTGNRSLRRRSNSPGSSLRR